jgi:ParB/RepB/Spo0J family partition protein
MTAKKNDAFSGLGAILGGGFDDMLTADATDIMVELDDVTIRQQEREEFEDADNTLLELGESLKKLQLQPIVLRHIDGLKPYELVAGERRYRAARLVGLTRLRAHVTRLTEAEADDARLAENIHRKNLTQIEEARRLKQDVDRDGVQATLARHHKSHAWLSKRLSLLNLPDQTQRLVTEQISADLEVINQVRQIEKLDPEAAQQLVGELKESRGQSRARTQVARVLQDVKPSKKAKRQVPPPPNPVAPTASPGEDAAPAGPLATSTSDAPESQPAARKSSSMADGFSLQTLDRAYTAIFEQGQTAADVLAKMADHIRIDAQRWLQDHADRAREAADVSRAVIEGFRHGTFATDGAGAFALAAFLYGKDAGEACDIERIFECVKD